MSPSLIIAVAAFASACALWWAEEKGSDYPRLYALLAFIFFSGPMIYNLFAEAARCPL